MKLRHKYQERTAEVVKIGTAFAGYGKRIPFKTLVTVKYLDGDHPGMEAATDLGGLRTYWKPAN
jgi:hypothetical protein